MDNKLEKKLIRLLEVLTDSLVDKLLDGTATPQEQKNAVELLKNNGITCEIKASGVEVANLLKQLPTFENDHFTSQ